MRSLLLAALVLSACAAHEPTPRIHAPDEPRPAQVEPDVRVVPEAAPQAEVPADEPTPRVKVVDAADSYEAGKRDAQDAIARDEPAPRVKVVDAADSYEEGKRAAQDAIARDELALATFGYPARCRYRYAQILREEYRVILREVAGCVVDESIIQHARGFNEVMEAEIMRRHGADVFEVAGRKAGCQ